jgi:hypothetical protein
MICSKHLGINLFALEITCAPVLPNLLEPLSSYIVLCILARGHAQVLWAPFKIKGRLSSSFVRVHRCLTGLTQRRVSREGNCWRSKWQVNERHCDRLSTDSTRRRKIPWTYSDGSVLSPRCRAVPWSPSCTSVDKAPIADYSANCCTLLRWTIRWPRPGG